MPPFNDVRNMVYTQAIGQPSLPDADLSGKTYAITGANAGLGFETVKHLMRLKASRVIMACRSLQKGEEAKQKILAETTFSTVHTKLDVWQVDLASYKSVLEFGSRLTAELPRLDGFIANAGVELTTFQLAEGLEQMITVNVVSTILTVLCAVPKLRETAAMTGSHTNATIVGSLYHCMAPDEDLDVPGGEDMLQWLSKDDVPVDKMLGRYALSKLMVHLCSHELAARVDGNSVVINWANPGWCSSELTRHRVEPLLPWIMKGLIGWTCEKGSRNVVWAAVADKKAHGQYVSESQVKEESTFVRSARGQEIRKRLWSDMVKRINGIDATAAAIVGK